ncbi:cobalamin-binding protein [Deltaproteobacteria bacterium]|nr:cobalamin-binding protein [Deltaproteobacteria bacterium]
MRVVSLCPSNTEILWALGAADVLVGLDRSSDFPESILGLPRVGPDIDVDVPTILALHPDLVLSSLSVPGMEKNVARLDAAGVPHIVIDAQSLAGVFENIRVVGRLLGLGGRAAEVVAGMQARLDAVAGVAGSRQVRPKVCLEWWPKPVIVPGARCWTTEMIRIAGGESAFAHLDVRSTPIEDARVPEAAPDVILTSWCGVPHERQRPDKVYERAGWADVPAVRNRRVFAAEERYFGRPGPRLVEGVEWLAGVLASG